MRPTLTCAMCALLFVSAPKSAVASATISGTAIATSDYRFRGISQNNLHAAPQLELDINADEWTAGTFISEVNFLDHEHTSIEIDFFAKKEFDFEETQLSLEAYYYTYPDHHASPGGIRYSMLEGVARASRSWGPFLASASVAWSPNYSGGTGTSLYIGATAAYDVTPYLSVSANVGRQWIATWDAQPHSGYPYAHWDFGVTLTRQSVSLDIRAVGTTLAPSQCLLVQGQADWCKAGIVATLSYMFEGAL